MVLLLLYCMYTPGSSSKRQRGLLLLLSSALLLLASYKNLLSPSACAFIHRSVGLVPMALSKTYSSRQKETAADKRRQQKTDGETDRDKRRDSSRQKETAADKRRQKETDRDITKKEIE